MIDRRGGVKCVVWDLDNTLWEGVLLEGDDVRLRDGAEAALRTLDDRGILLSIASRNDPATTEAKLRDLEIDGLFVHPQISWNAKSSAITAIARLLNIGADALAFVDDDPFERDEVSAALPEVLCIDAVELATLVDRPELIPRFVTEDSRRRRSMVQAEIVRSRDKQAVTPAEFLDSLGMVLTIADAGTDDLARAEELTVRTNQLNSTGYTYSYTELDDLRHSSAHRLLVAGLEDRYGAYGKIGLALVELHHDYWLLRVFLVSCRVMARGVGPTLLTHVLEEGAKAGKPVRAEFIRTDRNRPMYLMFKMAGFREIARDDGVAMLEHNLTAIAASPGYIEVRVSPEQRQ
ncbi:HAD-IIIC family phosphatase [soil metagenome]